MIRKAVIAAAGKGTRMKHLTKNKPKHVIKVNGKPFLGYLIENLHEAGFTDIVIVVGYQAHHIEDFVDRHPYPITLVNQYEVMGEEKYGTAVPIEAARAAIGEEPFLAVYGDNLYSVRDLAKLRQPDGYHYVAGYGVDDPSKYGVLIVDDHGHLVRIHEKPTEDVGSKLINAGLYRFTPEIFDVVSRVKPSASGEYYLTDALTELAGRNRVKVIHLEDFWLDLGNPGDIRKVSQFLKNQPSTRAPAPPPAAE